LPDIIYAIGGPFNVAPTQYMYILPPDRNAFYRSTYANGGSHASDWSLWSTEAIPSGEKPLYLANSSDPDENIVASCEDARFIWKPRGATGASRTDEPWVAMAAPAVLLRGYYKIGGSGGHSTGHWGGDATGNPPHGGDPNFEWLYTLGRDGVCYGTGASSAAFRTINTPFGAIGVLNQAAPAGTWNNFLFGMYDFGASMNLFGTNQIANWEMPNANTTTNWTVISVPNTNLMDSISAVTGNGTVAIAVGVGATPIMGCNDVTAIPQVWFSITPPGGWSPVRPRVAFSPNFNEFPTTRGTFFIIGGKVGAQNDVIKVKMKNDFTLDVAQTVTVPTVDSTNQWTGITNCTGTPGTIIIGVKTPYSNANLTMITNPADSSSSPDDNAWSYRTLSQVPFTS
jgi:hypothetical protein